MDKETFIEIWEKMFLIRTVEEGIGKRYSEGKMRCPIHLSIGQEAVPSVISTFMNTCDQVVSTHRSHAHYIAKGGSVKRMLFELYGKEDGCSHGRGGSMHLTDKDVGFMCATAIVGNTIPIGVGLAYKKKLDNDGSFVGIYLGDAATEEGVFYEAANFASIHKLPCLFICENNFYSVYSGLKDRQPDGRSLFKMVDGIGLRSSMSDGNDITLISSHMEPIISRLRQGEGPFFVEFQTYRTREHCGPHSDDHLGYRDEQEIAWWRKHDPLVLAEKWGKEKFGLEGLSVEYKCETEKLVDGFFKSAEQGSFPKPETLYRDIYSSLG